MCFNNGFVIEVFTIPQTISNCLGFGVCDTRSPASLTKKGSTLAID